MNATSRQVFVIHIHSIKSIEFEITEDTLIELKWSAAELTCLELGVSGTPSMKALGGIAGEHLMALQHLKCLRGVADPQRCRVAMQR